MRYHHAHAISRNHQLHSYLPQVIVVDSTHSTAIVCTVVSLCSRSKSQSSADDASIQEIPVSVTDGAPHAVHPRLNSTLPRNCGASHSVYLEIVYIWGGYLGYV